MVSVCARHHLHRGRAERAASIDLLASGVRVGGTVGSGPEAMGGAGEETVDVAPEDDGAVGRATGKERSELGALRVVRGHLNDLGRG